MSIIQTQVPLKTQHNEPCKHCGKKPSRICEDCQGYFCDDHGSVVEPNFCQMCLGLESVDYTSAPLLDEEGVPVPTGRRITLYGTRYKTLAQKLADMNEQQLAVHIDYHKTLVHEAEKVLEYRRIALSSAELELEERKAQNKRKRRALERVFNIGTANRSNVEKTQADAIFKALKNMGVTKEKFEAILAARKAQAK